MPIIDNTDAIEFPQAAVNTRWGMIACWAAPVDWDQTKQDAFCDAIKAGTRIFPVEATSGWDFTGLTSIPSVVEDKISGNGPDMTPTSTGLQINTVTPTWDF